MRTASWSNGRKFRHGSSSRASTTSSSFPSGQRCWAGCCSAATILTAPPSYAVPYKCKLKVKPAASFSARYMHPSASPTSRSAIRRCPTFGVSCLHYMCWCCSTNIFLPLLIRLAPGYGRRRGRPGGGAGKHRGALAGRLPRGRGLRLLF